MNPFEFRKTILIGLAFAAPDLPPLIGADGLPLTPIPGQVVVRVAFWIPQAQPYQRRGVRIHPNATVSDRLSDPLEGCTLVWDTKPFELQAMRDGALVEEIYDFQYPQQPTIEQLRNDVHPIWEKRTLETLGYLPNGAPIDRDPKLGVIFTAV
jgi:hypothetical protein